MLGAIHAAEQMRCFLRAQDDGVVLGLPGKRDVFSKGPFFLERNPVKETKRRNSCMYRVGGQLPLSREVDLIGPNVLGGQRIRRRAEIAREQRYLLEIRCLRMRRQIPHLHVLSHPLSKNSHEKLLCDTKALQAAPPACRNRASSGMQEDRVVAPKLATSHYPD